MKYIVFIIFTMFHLLYSKPLFSQYTLLLENKITLSNKVVMLGKPITVVYNNFITSKGKLQHVDSNFLVIVDNKGLTDTAYYKNIYNIRYHVPNAFKSAAGGYLGITGIISAVLPLSFYSTIVLNNDTDVNFLPGIIVMTIVNSGIAYSGYLLCFGKRNFKSTKYRYKAVK